LSMNNSNVERKTSKILLKLDDVSAGLSSVARYLLIKVPSDGIDWICAAFWQSRDQVQKLSGWLLVELKTVTAAHISSEELGVPSQGPLVLFILLILFLCVFAPVVLTSFRVKLLVSLMFCCFMYAWFITSEAVHRNRLAQLVHMQATRDILEQQASSRMLYRHSFVENRQFSEQWADDYSCATEENGGDGADVPNDTRTSHYEFHDATWLNSLIGTIWSISHVDNVSEVSQSSEAFLSSSKNSDLFKSSFHILNKTSVSSKDSNTVANGKGGFGFYVSDLYADLLNTELAKVPPGVANVRLKSFNLGSKPPMFKGVRVKRVRDRHCFFRHMHGSNFGGDTNHTSVNIGSESWYTTPSDIGKNISQKILYDDDDDDDDDVLHWIENLSISDIANFNLSSDSLSNVMELLGSKISSFSRGTNSAWRDVSQEAQDTLKDGALFSSTLCDMLVVDLDFVFASAKDMGIVLTLRPNDLKTLVPEFAVTLADVHLGGHIRLNISLHSSFPFLGDAKVVNTNSSLMLLIFLYIFNT
jgi:hypothetical protein